MKAMKNLVLIIPFVLISFITFSKHKHIKVSASKSYHPVSKQSKIFMTKFLKPCDGTYHKYIVWKFIIVGDKIYLKAAIIKMTGREK
jgi:hypothetical protein